MALARSDSPTHYRRTVAVLAVSLGTFGLLQSLVVPVLTEIQDRLDTDQATTAWILTAYLLSAAVSTPLTGRIGDSIGKQKVLIILMALLSVGSIMAALATSIEWMLVARVVQGLGGGVLPLSFGIIRDEVPAARRGPAVGLIASLLSASFGIGIVIAGPIVEGLGYSWLFWLPAIATSLATLASMVFIPESPVRMPGRIAVGSAVLLSSWLVALLLAVSEGNDRGWTSPIILGLIAAAVVLFIGWIVAENRAPTPLIDIALMRMRGVWTANVVALLSGFTTFSSLGFLPQLLQTPSEAGYGFGASISQSGWILLPSAASSFVLGLVAPRIVHRITARRVICAGAVVSAAAFGLVALQHDTTGHIAMWMVLQGIGSGCIMSSLAGVVLASVPPEQTGAASGMNANIRLIGGSLGSAMMAGIVTAQLGPTGLPVEAGYRAGFLVLSSMMVVLAFIALLIPSVPGHVVADRVGQADDPEVDRARAEI